MPLETRGVWNWPRSSLLLRESAFCWQGKGQLPQLYIILWIIYAVFRYLNSVPRSVVYLDKEDGMSWDKNNQGLLVKTKQRLDLILKLVYKSEFDIFFS